MSLVDLLTRRYDRPIFNTPYLLRLCSKEGLLAYDKSLTAHVLLNRIIGDWK